MLGQVEFNDTLQTSEDLEKAQDATEPVLSDLSSVAVVLTGQPPSLSACVSKQTFTEVRCHVYFADVCQPVKWSINKMFILHCLIRTV